jgi:multimeric flavodoxin WrbA
MSLKVLGILGSPRINGSNSLLLDTVLDGAKSQGAKTEKIFLNDISIKPCQDCDGCIKTGTCIINDDFQNIYEKLKTYDCFVIASPIYFYGITAQLKALIDRCQCIWVAKYKLYKPIAEERPTRRGIYISTRGKPGMEGFRGSTRQIKAFFTVNNINYFSKILYAGLNSKNSIREHADILEFAKNEGINLIKL